MAKSTKEAESLEEQAQVSIKAIRLDMVGIKYKLLNEIFLKIVNSQGKIDVNDQEFQQQKNSLLNSDPDSPENQGKAVISVMSFEKGSATKINKLIAKGASAELFTELQNDTTALREELTSKLSTEDGIIDLMSDLIARKSLEQVPFQVRLTKAEGMYNAGDLRPMNNTEKGELNNLLSHNVSLPPNVTSYLMSDMSAISNVVGPVVSKNVIGSFGVKGDDGAVTLDKAKLTPENIKIFTERVNADIIKIPAQDIVRKAIKHLEKEKGYTIAPNATQDIIDSLSPALAELDQEYLIQHSNIISQEIQKEIVAQSTIFSKLSGKPYVSQSALQKIHDNLLDKHLDRSDQSQISKIEQSLYHQGLTSSEIEARFSQLSIENARNISYDINEMSDQDLVVLRQKNPKQFDKIVFDKENSVSNPQEVADDIMNRAIGKLEKENGVKVDKHIIKKFKEKLSPALSNLDPEYLKQQADIISSEIQKDIYKHRSIGYIFGKGFSSSTANLEKISNNILNKNQKRSNDFELGIIQSSLYGLAATNTQIKERLTNLEVTKAREAKYDANKISSEQLVAMRKTNPALFDKIMLGQEQHKTVSASIAVGKMSVIEQAKNIGRKSKLPDANSLLTTPPLISNRKSTGHAK